MILQQSPLRIIEDDMLILNNNNNNSNIYNNNNNYIITRLKEFQYMENTKLTKDQQKIYDNLLEKPGGLHIISGTPGSGKTFIIRYLIYNLTNQNKSIILTATTGATAMRIFRLARTAHYQFGLPKEHDMFRSTLMYTDERYHELRNADIIIIDEMSMLTCKTLNMIIIQLCEACNIDVTNPFLNKKILLFGDLAQLPPICNCTIKNSSFCRACHITNSGFWQHSIIHKLSTSIRRQSDPRFLDFFNIIRIRKPTIEEINAYIGHIIVNEQQANDFIDKNTIIICTHLCDTQKYNTEILHKNF